MTLILLIGLIAVPLLLIYWGVLGKDRLLQLPTLAGVAILVLVIPQIIGIYRSPETILPADVIKDNGLLITLLVHILFYGAFAVGYINSKSRPQRLTNDLNKPDVLTGFFWFGCLLLAISLFGSWQLSQLCGGGFLSFYRQQTGAYTLDWRGMPVVYVNLARLAYPAIYCLLFATLKRPSLFRWFLMSLALIHPVLTIVLLGRRTAVMLLALSILIPLFFVKRWILPRWSVLVMVFGGAVVYYSFAEYRSQDLLKTSLADSAETLSLDSVQTAMNGNQKYTAEMAGTINVISAVNKTHDFGWGRGIWSATVGLLVPRQFVGQAFKNSLLSDWNSNKSLEKVYGGGKEYYTAVTGPCGAFAEFWYLGVLFFWVIGRVARHIWDRAVSGSAVSMLLYVGTTPIFVLIIFNDVSQIFGFLAMTLVPMIPLLWWISINSKTIRPAKNRRRKSESFNKENLPA